jgi:hypothetical protein
MGSILRIFGFAVLGVSMTHKIVAQQSGLSGFFESLEYGRPVLGVKIPFSWIDPSWKEGTIEIAEVTIEPGGSGMWKLAVQPRLVLKGVSIIGPKQNVAKAIQGITPKGINSLKILKIEVRPTDALGVIQLQEMTNTSKGITVTAGQKNEKTADLIYEIFGKTVDINWLE